MIQTVMLQPHEIKKRARALSAAQMNSRGFSRVNAVAAAGTISVPVAAKNLHGAPVNSPLAEMPAAAFCVGVVTVVSYAFAQRWARENGLCGRRQPLDLKAANLLRKRRGEPPFVLRGDA